MAEYKLGPDYLPILRRSTLGRAVPMALVAGGVGVFMGSGGAGGQGPLFWAILVLLMGGSLSYGLYRGFQQQKRAGDSYRLYLEEDRLRRVQDGLPEAVIPRDGIARILEVPGRSMTVKPVSGPRIHIHASLIGYDEVRARLAQWHEIEEVTGSRILGNRALVYLSMFLTLGLFWLTYSSHDAGTVKVAGSLLFLFLAFCSGFMVRSKEVPAVSRKAAWVGLIALASIAFRVWEAFQGRLP